jgi:hypothetical protein
LSGKAKEKKGKKEGKGKDVTKQTQTLAARLGRAALVL